MKISLKRTNSFLNNNRGISLVETLASIFVLSVILIGILMTNYFCINLNSLNTNYSIAFDAAKSRMEEIRSSDYDLISQTYDNQSFNISVLLGPGKGFSYVDSTNPKELVLVVSVCWKETGGRIMGECTEAGGSLVPGTDANGNGIVDSPVALTSYLVE